MSGQLRTLRNRIRSVENTKKITRAMEMVAAAKLRRFQDMMQRAKPFTEGLEKLLRKLSDESFANLHPFIEKREEKKIAFVVMTSDTGLCGSYNNDLLSMASKFMKDRKHQLPVLVGVGKNGILALKAAKCDFKNTFTDIRASRIDEITVELRKTLEELYLKKEVDAVYVVYSHFRTLTSYKPVIEKILPLERPAAEANAQSATEYLFSPSPEEVFKNLVPFYFEAKIRTIFLEAIVSEQIARMTAMSQATKNAKEMIDSLVLQRNKARQAAITKEIIEIVSGSQAAKK